MMDEDKYAPPPKYEDTGAYSETHTHTESTTHTATLGLNRDYIKTIPAILKIVEIVTSLACFITTFITITKADGWCGFVSGTVFFISLVWFFFYLFNLIEKIHPVRILIEWIYYLVLAICFLIASIVAAAFTAKGYKPMGAYAFFGFICCAALFVDLFFQFRVWRSQGVSSHNQSTTVTTSSAGHSTATTEVRY